MLKSRRFPWLKLGIIIGVLIPISLFIYHTDFHRVKQEINSIGANFLILLLSTFTAYLIGTWGWQICLGSERKKISFSRLFAIRQIGETVGLFNPSSIVGGDLLKANLLSSNGISEETALESVAVSRITALISQFFILSIAVGWLIIFHNKQFSTSVLLGLTSLIVVLSVFIIYIFKILNRENSRIHHTIEINQNIYRKISSFLHKILGRCQHFYQTKKQKFWLSLLLFLLHWIVGSFEFYIILDLTGYKVSIIQCILMDMGVVLIKSIAGFIPGQIGIEELGNQVVLMSIGIGAVSLWLTVSILRRARQLFWIICSGLFYLLLSKTINNNFSTNGDSVC